MTNKISSVLFGLAVILSPSVKAEAGSLREASLNWHYELLFEGVYKD